MGRWFNKANRGFADRSRRSHGHSYGGSGGKTADQIRRACAQGKTRHLSHAQIRVAEQRGWLKK